MTNNGFLTKEAISLLFPELPPLFGSNLVFSAEFGARKPDPQIYQRLLARLGVAPETTLMVDDDVTNVAGAEAAGLHGHVFDGIAGLIQRLAAFGIGTA
jgi:glucose-1-phosphatase